MTRNSGRVRGDVSEIDAGTIAVLTLNDGERLTADILRLNDEGDQLIVDVVSSNRHDDRKARQGRSIAVNCVVSVEPYNDPCRADSFSFGRFAFLSTLFLCMTIGSIPLFLLLPGRPYGLQAASAIVYTIFAVFSTFARIGGRGGKDLPPYMFTCPAVRKQISRLLGRHLGFLVALIAFQTLALAVRPHLPDWWNTDNKGTPFELGLLLLCLGLGYAQVFTNRRLLDRAHREGAS